VKIPVLFLNYTDVHVCWLFNIAVSITEVSEVLRDIYSLIPTDI